MQQRAFHPLFVRTPSPPLGLDDRAFAEHFEKATVSRIEEHRAVDPLRHGKGVTDRKAEALRIERDRPVEIRGAERDVMEARSGASSAHRLSPWLVLRARS